MISAIPMQAVHGVSCASYRKPQVSHVTKLPRSALCSALLLFHALIGSESITLERYWSVKRCQCKKYCSKLRAKEDEDRQTKMEKKKEDPSFSGEINMITIEDDMHTYVKTCLNFFASDKQYIQAGVSSEPFFPSLTTNQHKMSQLFFLRVYWLSSFSTPTWLYV